MKAILFGLDDTLILEGPALQAVGNDVDRDLAAPRTAVIRPIHVDRERRVGDHRRGRRPQAAQRATGRH